MFTKDDNKVFDEIIKARWTCRSFTDEVPTKEEIEAIIEAGKAAPYASIASKDVVPFRHFFVMFKDDPRLETIRRLTAEQSAADLEWLLKEEEKDAFLRENARGLETLWGHVAESGAPVTKAPCLIVMAEWRGARRAERQSLAHMLENMWLKATALNLDVMILSIIESMVDNKEFCDLFGLPVGMYGFHACIIGHHKGEGKVPKPCTSEIHWL